MKRYICAMAGCIVAIMALCSVAYYQSYKKAVNDGSNYVYKTKEPENEAVNVDNDGQKISAKCELTTINHEVSDDSEEKIITEITPEYVGMTMQELEDRLLSESENPSLDEINKGFIRAELVSFESKNVTIIRYYSKNDIPDKYFMILEGDYLTIYYADRETVFENTGISKDDLRAEEISALNKGISVEDEHTLISILEGYTS